MRLHWVPYEEHQLLLAELDSGWQASEEGLLLQLGVCHRSVVCAGDGVFGAAKCTGSHRGHHRGSQRTEAPAIEKLAHLDGELTAERYHSECCYQTNEISVVILNDTQHTETTIDSNDGVFDFAAALGRQSQPSKVYSYRKGKADKDLCIFYHPEQEGTVNAKASQLLKMRIYGPALLVQCSKETSFLPRERFVSYTQEMYEAQYTKKRKEKKVQHMETGDYESAKKDMQKELNTFEAKQSQRALPPKELAAVTKMAPMSGHALAEMHPPPVRRQVSVM